MLDCLLQRKNLLWCWCANFGRVEAIDDFREYILISRDYIHCSRTSGHTFLQLFFLQSFEAKLVER